MMRPILVGALLLLTTLVGVGQEAPLMTNVPVAWDPSPDAPSGRVLSYRVEVGGIRLAETGGLTAMVPVRRGVAETLTVRSFGRFDVNGDGTLEDGEVGEGPPSMPVTYTAPSIHMPGFRGCYADLVGGVRALPAQLASTNATSASCITAAKSRGYRFAGVQFRGECFAGDVPRYDVRPVTECNLPCTARPGELCGGSSRNSVYPTGLPPLAPSDVAIVK
jgi:hypothetical protein